MDERVTKEAFPLAWPEHYPRTPRERRRTSPFSVSPAQARDDLLNELRRLGARDIVLSSNVRTARDGFMVGDYKEPQDPGVAVYFIRPKRSGGATAYAMACDSYATVRSNLRALGLTVAALRTIERHGSRELLERAFTGFAALPPMGGGSRHWSEVLGVSTSVSDDAIRAAFHTLARVHHPDKGGDTETFARISRAYQEAQTERGFQ